MAVVKVGWQLHAVSFSCFQENGQRQLIIGDNAIGGGRDRFRLSGPFDPHRSALDKADNPLFVVDSDLRIAAAELEPLMAGGEERLGLCRGHHPCTCHFVPASPWASLTTYIDQLGVPRESDHRHEIESIPKHGSREGSSSSKTTMHVCIQSSAWLGPYELTSRLSY